MSGSDERSLESIGQGFRIDSPGRDELFGVIEAALDYRGDITLRLRNGNEICGYIFNRRTDGDAPYLELLAKNSDQKERVLYSDIAGIFFRGLDPASGKSWERWVEQYNAKKAARDRGEDVGPIGIDAEPLD